MNKLSPVLLMFLCLLIFSNASLAQEKKKVEFGKGLRYVPKDSSFYIKASVRAQNRFDLEYDEEATDKTVTRFIIRRARLKFDGWVLSPKFTYKMEFDVVGGYVRDAWVKWNFYKNVSVQYGLGKLPGNRERVVSSQKLQFVDRSQLNGAFTLDRDMGIWLHHHFKLGNMFIKETFTYSDGRGINDFSKHSGQSYTGRVDFYPFGKFQRKGDYFFADFAREKKPKLMIGGVYNYNDQAINSRGQIGREMAETRNLSTIMADFMFKYNGLTIFGEYAHKEVVDSIPVAFYEVEKDSLVKGSFYTGFGYVGQIGYLFKRNWEISARYTAIRPESLTGRDDVNEYTLGLSKYIVEHSLKVQTDVSYRENNVFFDGIGEKLIYRFQVELSF